MDKNFRTKRAKVIVSNAKQITKLWQQINHYQKYGAAMQDQKVFKRAVEDMSIGEIITACLNLPSYLTKAKKRLSQMPDGPDKLKLSLDVAIKQRELDEIKAMRS